MGTWLKTFSAKHAGTGHSKSSADRAVGAANFRCDWKPTAAPLLSVLLLFLLGWVIPAHSDNRAPTLKERAAERCAQKLKKIEDFPEQVESDGELTTLITEEEINAYLDLNLHSKYQPCLKNMRLTLKEDILEGLASVDFDCLEEKSSGAYPGYIALLFSGTHVITSRGRVISDGGEGRLELEQAMFDGNRLPNFLVEEVVEAVCEARELPFNPLQPSRLPHAIKRITVHPGYLKVFQ